MNFLPFFFIIMSGFFSFSPLFPIYAENSAPYLIPQTVFIGDRALLVIPLEHADYQSSVPDLPENTDALVFHKITLERKGDAASIAIDFTAYKTGVLALPDIPGFESLSGLTVTVASLLTSSSMTLSPSVAPMPAPGTASLIYGCVVAIILCCLLGIGIHLFRTNRFGGLRRRLIQQYFIIRMKLFIAKTRKNIRCDALDLLSAEFRKFLTYFAGVNCYAMSAGEFAGLPDLAHDSAVLNGDHGFSLKKIFSALDALRFKPENADDSEVTALFDETQTFISSLHPLLGEKGEKI